MPVPNEKNDMNIDPGQQVAMVNSLAMQFSKVVDEINKVKHDHQHKKLAKAIGKYLDGLLESFGPYLKGEDPSDDTGFRELIEREVSNHLNDTLGHYEEAEVADDLPDDDPFYCPRLRKWVKKPSDCPDYLN